MRNRFRTKFGSMFLGIGLSVMLVASFSHFAFADETFRQFDGTDKIDIDSAWDLKLDHFVIQSEIRIHSAPEERGYLISKGADGDWKRGDQNYALFVEPSRKIGGGFKATDGTHHFIYSDPISLDAWHTAKLAYDGARLRLFVDGELEAIKRIKKDPDMGQEGDLRIGANAKALNNYFVGDMGHAKVMNRDTWKVAYYNDFRGGTTTSPTPTPDPVPSPDPVPVPSGGTDCDSKPMDQLRGVAFMDPVLTRNERGGGFNAPDNYVSDSMQRLKSYGFNLVRVPYYWESFAHNPTQFLDELELVAKTAQANNICVVFDNHHWFTSSHWNTDIGVSGNAIGFPSFVVKSFPSKATYYDTAGPFWNALLSNSLSIDGKKIWDVQWDFISKVVNRVDGYSSVAGYEILNEPHLWSKTQYEKLGDYNTFFAQKIRSISDKKILFTRETTKEFTRDPTLEHKIVPRGVSKLVYSPHLYSVPVSGSGGLKQVQNIERWSQDWNVEVMIGEFSGHTQADNTAFLKAWEQYGFGWTYWKWSKATRTGGDHLGNVVYESDSVAKTEALRWLLSSYGYVY